MVKQEQVNRVNVALDSAIIKKLREARISEREMGSAEVVLIGMLNDEVEVLDEMDQENSNRDFVLFFKSLEHKGLVQVDKDGPLNWKLTKKGTDLATFILERSDSQIVTQVQILDKETGELVEQEPTDLQKLAREVNAAFPPSNDQKRQLRRGYDNTLRKLEVFKSNYSFPEDVVLDAVKLYLAEQEDSPSGHQFTQNCSNFIAEQDKTGKVLSSTLAGWCEKVLEERKSPTQSFNTKSLDTV